jgi:hypothetical protein
MNVRLVSVICESVSSLLLDSGLAIAMRTTLLSARLCVLRQEIGVVVQGCWCPGGFQMHGPEVFRLSVQLGAHR